MSSSDVVPPLILIDPPDRLSFTDGPVRRLTYAQADRAISALAARLRSFGLPTDSVVAIQLPNTVESVIALLAVMRAGLIAAPLPLLWRHADAAAALSRVAARALIGCQRIGDTVHGDLAMHIAMETGGRRQRSIVARRSDLRSQPRSECFTGL